MTLQILINHYNEEPAILGRLLKSIEEQDFDKNKYEVLIASDGDTHKLSWDFLAQFPFIIKYYVLPHRGVCATRNFLLGESFADYVMFCDADDMFSKSNGLSLLIEAAYKSCADIVGSRYQAETKNGNIFVYSDYVKDIIRVHGKIFRLQYLREENLYYPDEMIQAGDMCFLWEAYNLTDNIIWINDSFYIWKWNDKSVTRCHDNHGKRVYNLTTRNYHILTERLINRNRPDLYNKEIVTMIHSRYIDYYEREWNLVEPECFERAAVSIANYVKAFRSYYDLIDEDYKYKKYNRMLIKKRTYGPPTKYKGIGPWMDEIVEKYG